MTLQPIQQDYFNENRERYGADTTVTETTLSRCTHELKKQGDDLVCTLCHAGWIGLGRLKLSK